MLGIGSIFKNVQETAIDSLVRPVIGSKAKQGINQLCLEFESLPTYIKEYLDTMLNPNNHTQKGNISKKMILFMRRNFIESAKGQAKLDGFLKELMEKLRPVFLELIANADKEITDYAMVEVKVGLGIIEPLPISIKETTIEWPALTVDKNEALVSKKIGHKVRQKSREFNKRLVPNVLELIPDVLVQVFDSILSKELEQEFNDLKTGVESIDDLISKTHKKADDIQDSFTRELCENVFEGIKDTLTHHLVQYLVGFEDMLDKTAAEQVANLPFFD